MEWQVHVQNSLLVDPNLDELSCIQGWWTNW
jgi:hypothetical protein